MDGQEGTRELKAQVYVHNETQLLYVLDLAEGSAIVEDVRTGKVVSMDPAELEGWTVMDRG